MKSGKVLGVLCVLTVFKICCGLAYRLSWSNPCLQSTSAQLTKRSLGRQPNELEYLRQLVEDALVTVQIAQNIKDKIEDYISNRDHIRYLQMQTPISDLSWGTYHHLSRDSFFLHIYKLLCKATLYIRHMKQNLRQHQGHEVRDQEILELLVLLTELQQGRFGAGGLSNMLCDTFRIETHLLASVQMDLGHIPGQFIGGSLAQAEDDIYVIADSLKTTLSNLAGNINLILTSYLN